MKKTICLLFFLASLLPVMAQSGSLSINRDTITHSDTLKPNFTLTGKIVNGHAGIYNADFDGSKTASGEIFLNIRLTGASNDFALNSWVRVTNVQNKKYVIVRINDRITGKKNKKRLAIRLSLEAGKTIGIKKDNIRKVKIESIVPVDSLSFEYYHSDTVYRPIDTLTRKDSLTPNTFKPVGKAITGIASFYSYNLDGTETSTGERYRNNKLTAASNNFKLNTWVLVTNLRNKKSVIVRINDHMHPRMKKKGRVVDLSRIAARQLDFMNDGLTKVKVQPVVFVFSPDVKKQLDSLQEIRDSIRVTDSVNTEPEKKDENAVTGIASFYSSNLDGTLTATGETYRNNRMSAASNDFDLNTWVRVTNVHNNKSVIVRINDRMHPKMQKKGRVVDLSRIAAKKLDFIKNGLTKVKVEIIPTEALE